jgi:predicted transcriptional regulator
MKITVEVDITPQEARTFLGLPDMTPVHDAFINEAKSKIAQTSGLLDIDPIVKTWTGIGGVAQDALTTLLGAAARSAAGTTTRPSESKAASGKPAAEPNKD